MTEFVDVKERLVYSLLEDTTESCYIPPDSNVLTVGPGCFSHFCDKPMDRPQDIGMVALLDYLDAGRMTILDLPPILEEGSFKQGGCRNWPKVKTYLDHLVDDGASLAPYEFVEGDIFDETSIGEFDVIHDHFTWMFAHPPDEFNKASNRLPRLEERYQSLRNRFLRLAERYQSLLKDGGKALFYFNERWGYPGEHDELLDALVSTGFSIPKVYFNMTDRYIVRDPVVREDFQAAKFFHNDGTAWTYHNATGLIVAVK